MVKHVVDDDQQDETNFDINNNRWGESEFYTALTAREFDVIGTLLSWFHAYSTTLRNRYFLLAMQAATCRAEFICLNTACTYREKF